MTRVLRRKDDKSKRDKNRDGRKHLKVEKKSVGIGGVEKLRGAEICDDKEEEEEEETISEVRMNSDRKNGDRTKKWKEGRTCWQAHCEGTKLFWIN